MSTLKKVLALTLALAMILSVSAFAGSYKADTYKDAASIDKDCEDSIELLYALDIMQGDAQGNFRPNDTITRAEVAKMIYVIKNYGKMIRLSPIRTRRSSPTFPLPPGMPATSTTAASPS